MWEAGEILQGVSRDAIKTIESEFGIKSKKEVSLKTSVKTWSVPSSSSSSTDVNYTIKKALLSATTSPYLRAVVVLLETKETKEALFIEMDEHPLSATEKVAALLHSKEQMKAIKELGATHTMEASWLTRLIFEIVQEKQATNIHIINIHHDYIRSFYEVPIDSSPVIWEVMENDFHEQTKVISILEKGGVDEEVEQQRSRGNKDGNDDTTGLLEDSKRERGTF